MQKLAKPAMVRQGDVLLIPAEPQTEATRAYEARDPRGRLVLAEGKSNGLPHGVSHPRAKLYAVDGVRYLELAERCDLVHGDRKDTALGHEAISLPAGTYEVRRQFDLIDGRERVVED